MRGLVGAAILVLSGIALPRAMADDAVPDYRDPSNWLCRPARADACRADLDASVVARDGSVTIEHFLPAADPAIDCFYIYPTVSTEPTGNSDMTVGEDEAMSARQQFARFGASCRLYAPMYRQVTVSALRAASSAHPLPASMDEAYGDVVAAFRSYLARDNHGRGFILIGHSQGAHHLQRLLQEQLQDPAARRLMVAAYVIGYALPVKDDRHFAGFPLCDETQTVGCIIAYSSFRESLPPPRNARFGRTAEPGTHAACVNPAALGGGTAQLHAYLTDQVSAAFPAQPVEWVKGIALKTPFVAVPGLLSGECVTRDGATYLSIRIDPNPLGTRTSAIRGDAVRADGQVMAEWGLHPIDMHLAMGDLVALARIQGDAWIANEGR